MTRFVLDASVALAWVVDRGAEPYAIAVQNKILKGDRPIVPEFWQLEIANVLALVLRKGTLTADEIEKFTIDINAKVSKSTIVGYLQDLPEAVERRRKLSKHN